MRTRFVGFSLTLLGFSTSPRIATWHGPGATATLQNGRGLAYPGHTVLVACDTYEEHHIKMAPGVTLGSATATDWARSPSLKRGR